MARIQGIRRTGSSFRTKFFLDAGDHDVIWFHLFHKVEFRGPNSI